MTTATPLVGEGWYRRVLPLALAPLRAAFIAPFQPTGLGSTAETARPRSRAPARPLALLSQPHTEPSKGSRLHRKLTSSSISARISGGALVCRDPPPQQQQQQPHISPLSSPLSFSARAEPFGGWGEAPHNADLISVHARKAYLLSYNEAVIRLSPRTKCDSIGSNCLGCKFQKVQIHATTTRRA